jgi:hypothetical protein
MQLTGAQHGCIIERLNNFLRKVWLRKHGQKCRIKIKINCLNACIHILYCTATLYIYIEHTFVKNNFNISSFK